MSSRCNASFTSCNSSTPEPLATSLAKISRTAEGSCGCSSCTACTSWPNSPSSSRPPSNRATSR
eukprot:scaffold1054_cov116-Isochrysis_galbana.AAC.32